MNQEYPLQPPLLAAQRARARSACSYSEQLNPKHSQTFQTKQPWEVYMQELEFEGAADHGMWFVTSFTAAQQRALSQALPLLLGQEYDLKLQVLPALQGNTNFPGRNNLKCYLHI